MGSGNGPCRLWRQRLSSQSDGPLNLPCIRRYADADLQEDLSLLRVLTELRRRNGFRVAGMYLVAAWIAMQIVEVMPPVIHFSCGGDS